MQLFTTTQDILQITDDLDGAIKNYLLAIRLDEKYLKAMINLGIAYQSKGDIAEAIEWFEKTLKIDPELEIAKNKLQELKE